tara:strand:- start:1027 stop:1221 length:195 start_codon:yes stop_codon:yes gene_type:complete
MNKIMVLSDGETWDMAANCYTLELTDSQLEELEEGGNIFDILKEPVNPLLEKITERMKAEDLND